MATMPTGWMRFSPRALGLLCAVVPALALRGQDRRLHDTAVQAYASRAELRGLADSLDRVAETPSSSGRQRESARATADIVRRRLAEGDVRPGDRLLVRVGTDQMRGDTVVVTPAVGVVLAGIPELSLQGALLSELQVTLQGQVERFVRNAKVSIEPLRSVGILGAVTRPGYYLLPISGSATDAIMAAGGPTAEADPNGIIVRRGGKVRWTRTDMTAATQRQLSLASLGVETGDLITVDRLSPPIDRGFVLTVAGFALQAVFAVTTILAISR